MRGVFAEGFGDFWRLQSQGANRAPAVDAPGLRLSAGVATFSVQPSDPITFGHYRSQLVAQSLPRFGRWSLSASFMLPKLWDNDAGIISLHGVPDAGETELRSGPITVYVRGDELRVCTRAMGMEAMTPSNPAEVVIGRAKVTPGVWHSLDVDLSLSWLPGVGYLHASLNGRGFGAYVGATAYNDAVAPFPKLGPSAWEPISAPMVMLSRGMVIQ